MLTKKNNSFSGSSESSNICYGFFSPQLHLRLIADAVAIDLFYAVASLSTKILDVKGYAVFFS